jgi:DNA recombination protein Rad52
MEGINTTLEQEKEEVLIDVKDLQPNLLDEKPTVDKISTRQGKGGMKFHYYETHVVISMANHIFGFDGWCSEVMSEWFSEPEKKGNKFSISCIIRMRVTLRESKVYHEDYGNSTKVDADPGQARCDAAKTASSDALKRTLRKFGDKMGNKLYDKDFLNDIDQQKKGRQPLPKVAAHVSPAIKKSNNSNYVPQGMSAKKAIPVVAKTVPVVAIAGVKRCQFGSPSVDAAKKAKLSTPQLEVSLSKTAASYISVSDKSITINNNVVNTDVKLPLPTSNKLDIILDDEDEDDDLANLSQIVLNSKKSK